MRTFGSIAGRSYDNVDFDCGISGHVTLQKYGFWGTQRTVSIVDGELTCVDNIERLIDGTVLDAYCDCTPQRDGTIRSVVTLETDCGMAYLHFVGRDEPQVY